MTTLAFTLMVYLDHKYPDSYPMFPALFLGLGLAAVLTGVVR